MLVDGGKEWDCYKMKVIIIKKWEIVIKKVYKKKEAIIIF
jgi:hypothetical protein